ncbi:T9SS type A sorting domain-containing protein [bacterium BMS3Abin03]|nr:T9SS type A sorting domain-containing protein [bacterium BMS3Abin03]
MKKVFFLLILILCLGSLSAQTFKTSLLGPTSISKNLAASDTLKILAVMVNFAEDKDGATVGNGKFGSIYTEDYGTSILDPLPHNDEYFKSHIQFVKNYFSKVSNGKLAVEYTILEDTFSVSQAMRNYSPPPGSNDFTSLADFSVEAWTKADQVYPAFNFSAYNVFIIFHAGVGRDVSLPGSIGNERDLPSVYLSQSAFKNIYGSDFDGIPVSGGTFNIPNTMIIPETESRELETVSGKYLFQITINGLLCASIGSYLGLPDLFDTETGLSAIGRFGLMDGQSIFAYNGAFPPEPSPWTKIRLGWAEPVTVNLGSNEVSVVTRLAAEIGDTVILKVPLNSSEYYLIENRNRDVNNDGSKVTLNINGKVETRTYDKDTTGYYSFDVDTLEGVVTDVDEFDWAVPGNGIVIWHIDENIINKKIAENKINTDKHHRGVDVEEADGIQDIGEKFYTVLGDEVIGEGEKEDFWYVSNPAELYQNRFANDTRPDTKTNSGANSLITIKDFSDIANRMNFKVEYGDSIVKPILSNEINLSSDNKSISISRFDNSPAYLILNGTNLVVHNGTSIVKTLSDFSVFKNASVLENDILQIYGAKDSTLTYSLSEGTTTENGEINVKRILSSAPVINTLDNGNKQVVIGTLDGKIITYSPASFGSLPQQQDMVDVSTQHLINKVAANGSFIASTGRMTNKIYPQTHLFWSNEGTVELVDELPIDLAVTKDINGNNIAVVLTDKNRLYVINKSSIITEFNIKSNGNINSFSLTDLKQDGTNYIVLNNGNNIEAYNLTGAMADNFPFVDPESIGFVGTPLTADFEGDNKSEIISVTIDGRIFAIDGGTGKVIPGFPISAGSGIPVTPILYNTNSKTNLAVLNDQNVLSVWSISSIDGKLYWTEENGNPQNSSFIEAAETGNAINQFFPTSRAYNYPNPVYGSETNIRYYVSEDSKINIKIFDLAGDFVAELNDNAQGGMDNETLWNVSDIQSGVYIVRIEATSTNGKKENAIIKIAVAK